MINIEKFDLGSVSSESLLGILIIIGIIGLYLHPRISRYYVRKGVTQGKKQAEDAGIKKDLMDLKDAVSELDGKVDCFREAIIPLVSRVDAQERRQKHAEDRLDRLELAVPITPYPKKNGEFP